MVASSRSMTPEEVALATSLRGVSQSGLKFLSVKNKLGFSIIHKGGILEATDSTT